MILGKLLRQDVQGYIAVRWVVIQSDQGVGAAVLKAIVSGAG